MKKTRQQTKKQNVTQMDGNSELEYEPSDSDETESDISEENEDLDIDIEIPKEASIIESEEFLSCTNSVNKDKNTLESKIVFGDKKTVFIQSFELDIASAPNDQVLKIIKPINSIFFLR